MFPIIYLFLFLWIIAEKTISWRNKLKGILFITYYLFYLLFLAFIFVINMIKEIGFIATKTNNCNCLKTAFINEWWL